MNKIQILDCTLRDGGYVNDWAFGAENIENIIRQVSASGVDIMEMGFFRDEAYSTERSIFNDVCQVEKLCGFSKKQDLLFAGLIEMANPFPIEMISQYNSSGRFSAIRYSFWKRLIDDAFEYCSLIKDKGYLLCCQPTRVEQYSYCDFALMCKRFSKLKPYALYIVDTFGLLEKDKLLEYARVANESLDDGVILGYHAHNNMGQAFENTCAFIEQDYQGRIIQIDATVGGIGRGAGNLNLEDILDYLNLNYSASYNVSQIKDLLNSVILPIKEVYPWGYDEIYHLVAANSLNPNYATYFKKSDMTMGQIIAAVSLIQGSDKYLYSEEKAEFYKKRGEQSDAAK